MGSEIQRRRCPSIRNSADELPFTISPSFNIGFLLPAQASETVLAGAPESFEIAFGNPRDFADFSGGEQIASGRQRGDLPIRWLLPRSGPAGTAAGRRS